MRNKHPEASCWEWPDARSVEGYGRAWDAGVGVYAHRLVYERLVGPIPEGYEIHHSCGNRGCVNPVHLEAISTSGHRALHPMQLKSHCKQGHPYSGDNVYISSSGRRVCRACNRRNGAIVRARAKQRKAAV